MSKHYQYVHEYLTWLHQIRAALAAGRKVRVHWSDNPMDTTAFHREFMTALHSRINTKGGLQQIGRKFSADYQIAQRRDCYRVRDMARRIRVYQLETAELRARFGHRLARYDD